MEEMKTGNPYGTEPAKKDNRILIYSALAAALLLTWGYIITIKIR